MKNKAFLIITCCLLLKTSIHCTSMNQRLYDYLKSKWTELSNSSYTKLIPKKTFSYILPAMSIVPGALIGRMIAENKLIQAIPEDPTWAYLTSRKNYEIVRSWGILGGLAALATYKMISYYLQEPTSENGNETPAKQ